LRSIGAQIEKTTNREACRDLSGRRLRDINEEKKLKSWLEKKRKEQEEKDPDEKFNRKIEKLLAKPKAKNSEQDEEYYASRSTLLETLSDSVEQGFKRVICSETVTSEQTILSSVGLKRKLPETNNDNNSNSSGQKKVAKKIKGALWIDEGFSTGDSDSSDDDDNDNDDDNFEQGESSSSSKP
jgi:hypothetical protein